MIADFDRRLNQKIAADKRRLGEIAGMDEHYGAMGVDLDSMVTAMLGYLLMAGIRPDADEASAACSLGGRMLEIGIDIGREQTEARLG